MAEGFADGPAQESWRADLVRLLHATKGFVRTAHAFSGKAKSLGTKAEVPEEGLSPGEINFTLGLAGSYTDEVEAFLAKALPRLLKIAALIET